MIVCDIVLHIGTLRNMAAARVWQYNMHNASCSGRAVHIVCHVTTMYLSMQYRLYFVVVNSRCRSAQFKGKFSRETPCAVFLNKKYFTLYSLTSTLILIAHIILLSFECIRRLFKDNWRYFSPPSLWNRGLTLYFTFFLLIPLLFLSRIWQHIFL